MSTSQSGPEKADPLHAHQSVITAELVRKNVYVLQIATPGFHW